MTVWRAELLRIAGPVLAGLAAGLLLESPGWGVAVGALLALGWQLLLMIGLARAVRSRGRGSGLHGLAGEIAAAWRLQRSKDAARRTELIRLRRDFVGSARAMPDAVIVLDAGGAILWANDAACRWFGLVIPGDVGRPLVQLARDPMLVEHLKAPGMKAELEMASPERAQTELLVHLVPYGEGRTLLLARDISRLKRLERMRRDFVANVSHELRSPLTVVSGYLELLSEDVQAPPSWKAPLAEARRQVARMVAIVRDLLELARLESESTPPPRSPVDMTSLIERVRSQVVAGGIGNRHIQVRLLSRARFLGSETEIESAVGNLLSNAVKYTADDGSIDVTWRMTNSGVELSVVDDGIGIPAREIPRLTERFYRVDKARSARSGGTGLGLAIVKHIVERHGGELRIESRVGAGSRFIIALPAARVEPGATEHEAAQTAG